MQAQSPGIWEKTIAPGIAMTCNTNLNIISVTNKNGNNITYKCKEGIRISDIEQIENGVLKSMTVAKARD